MFSLVILLISLGSNSRRKMSWPRGAEPLMKSRVPTGTKLHVSKSNTDLVSLAL